MLSVREYLPSGILPKDPQKARKLRVKEPQYKIIDDILYRKLYLSPWLRCVGPIHAKSIIQEIHQGSCGMNARSRSVVSKIMKLGTFTNGFERCKVPGHSHQLLYEMGRGEAPSRVYEQRHRHGYGTKIGKEPSRLARKPSFPKKKSVEIRRIKEFEVRKNDKRRREDLDILEEQREIASIRELTTSKS
ncbi:hypothetical protein Tco_0295011 [Tanacetum coccineum]